MTPIDAELPLPVATASGLPLLLLRAAPDVWAVRRTDAATPPAGTARLSPLPGARGVARALVEVPEGCRRRGVGELLFARLYLEARRRGLLRLRVEVASPWIGEWAGALGAVPAPDAPGMVDVPVQPRLHWLPRSGPASRLRRVMQALLRAASHEPGARQRVSAASVRPAAAGPAPALARSA